MIGNNYAYMKVGIFQLFRQYFEHYMYGAIDKFSGKTDIPIEYFKQFLPENPVIFEAGAHKGKDTVKLSKIWPEGKIYAFEPVPELYQKLRENTKKLKNVHTYMIALGEISGTNRLYISSGTSDGSSSLLSPKEHLNVYPTVKFDKLLQVKTITLDEWAKTNNINNIDFMWLDLQGMELKVLKSGLTLLKTVKVIYTEAMIVEQYEGQNLYPDIKEWLQDQGFYIEIEKFFRGSGNILFVRKDE